MGRMIPPQRWMAARRVDGELREMQVFPYYERAVMYIEMLRLENAGEGSYEIRLLREADD